ncbi:hypothetical protein [Fusobacterium polymorphum]|uniref:hypothetical protein n=1 Tax=Fusobacterium nucleatum subsp. polymorphum TaxID=76857 RepID=UPI0030D4F58F
MSKYNVYRSIIDKNIKKEFKDSDWCTSLMYYGTWQCKIDGLIAATYLFCPEIIEIEGHIFIKEFCTYEEGEETDFLNELNVTGKWSGVSPSGVTIEGFVQNDYITTAYPQRPVSTP